ncbi:MAG TPA: HAD family hydrolase [Bacilli bacterium]|nr:HAD family hydrolase [Bacilli bacterium]
MTYKAILFDLDGTLGGYGLGNGVFLQTVWEQLRERFPGLTFGELKDFLLTYRGLETQCWGDWVKKVLVLEQAQVKVHIFEQLLLRYGVEAEEAKELAPHYLTAMLQAFPDDFRPAEGAEDVLKWAKSTGAVLCVLSNGHADQQTAKLRDAGLLPYFDHLLFSAEVGFSKPDPRYFQHALELAWCAPEEALMIGDSFSHDIEPAEKLGMQRVWVQADAKILGLPDERTVTELREVPALFGQRV